METLRFILKYIARHKRAYLGGMITLFVVDAANIFIPRITGAITDGLTARTMSWRDICFWLVGLLVLGLILAVGRFFWRYFIFGTSRTIERELRDDMFAHLETLESEYYLDHKPGDLMTRFTSDLNVIREAIGPAVICVFDATVMTVMVLVQMLFYVNVRLTLLTLIPMLIIFVGEFVYGRIILPRYRARQEALSDLTDFVQESFSGVRVIKAFVREHAQRASFVRANAKAMEKNLRVAKVNAVIIPLLDVVIGLGSLITLLYGGYLALIGEITLGRFVAFNQYINLLVWPMLAAGQAVQMFSQGAASIRRIRDIFAREPKVADRPGAREASLKGGISLDHLTFTYPGAREPALRDITLDIPAGTTLAVIGRTGSGKSTLASLLLRLYNTEPGMICLDGTEIGDLTLQSLRRNIAYVPQDNFLFSDTLAGNISFGSEDLGPEGVRRAAEQACIHDDIVSFPQGYDTVVGERGVTLSGGQKQRTSIARALGKDAPILILDDALSAVDTDTEEQILENLRENRRGRTTILIAHRISTIQNADQILVLEGGRAAELGTHAQLMALGGIYRSMFKQQQLEAAIGAIGEVDAP